MNHLPADPEHAQYPIYQYPPNSPPMVPDVQFHPVANTYVIPVAVAVANEASANPERSIIRMFGFNTMAANNWNTPLYAEACKTVLDEVAMTLLQNQQPNLPAIASNIVSMYCAANALNYPQVVSMCDHRTVQAIQGAYNDLMGVLTSHDELYNPRNAGVGIGARAVGRPSVHGAARSVQGRGNTSMAHPAAALNRQTQGGPMQRTPPRQEPSRSRRDVPEKKEEAFVTGGIEAVDRAVHQIAYFGDVYSLDAKKRRTEYERAVEKVAEHVENGSKTPVAFVNPNNVADSSFQAIFHAMRRRFLTQNDGVVDIFLGTGTEVTPIFAPFSMKELFDTLSTANNFAVIQETVQNHIKQVKSKADEVYLAATLAYLSQIDTVLTSACNRFMQYACNDTLRMGSFFEDIEEFRKRVIMRSPEVIDAYQSFQRQVCRGLFRFGRELNQSSGEADNHLIRDLFGGDEDEKDQLYMELLATTGIVAFIKAGSNELAYDIDSSNKRILAKDTPMLQLLVKSMEELATKAEFAVLRRYIVTTDNVTYEIFKSAAVPGAFYAVKV